jgi:hypothetical protein
MLPGNWKLERRKDLVDAANGSTTDESDGAARQRVELVEEPDERRFDFDGARRFDEAKKSPIDVEEEGPVGCKVGNHYSCLGDS